MAQIWPLGASFGSVRQPQSCQRHARREPKAAQECPLETQGCREAAKLSPKGAQRTPKRAKRPLEDSPGPPKERPSRPTGT